MGTHLTMHDMLPALVLDRLAKAWKPGLAP